jgi:glucose/arabinose dehydrogenase
MKRRACLPVLLLSTLASVGMTRCGDTAGERPAPQAVAIDVLAFEGRTQRAPAGSAVPTRPAVRAVDAQGQGVSGLVVTFRVIDGGGQVSGEVVTTNQQGVARLGSWTLGAAPGLNRVAARTPGLAEVLFEATGEASGPTMVAHVGDAQVGRAGEALAQAPAVLVRDAQGPPQAGVSVRFEVMSGGGSVAQAAAVTDAAGVASAGGWTLGPAPGPNTLGARADGVPPVVFTASGLSGEAPTLKREVVLSGLDIPWAMAFLPDGTLLITERAGRVRSLAPGASAPVTILEPPADLAAAGQSGLLGIAVDPEFATNRAVYTYQSSNLSGGMDNRIVRWTLSADGRALGERRDLLVGIPWGSGGGHSGGRLRVGADGHLYATTGDNRTGFIPQDLTGLGGKVVRIARDGSIPADNPQLGPDARRELFAYGFRNPQGLALRPGAGELYLCEHGPNDSDEVTRLVSGGNGGWNPNGPDGRYIGYEGAKMTDIAQFPDAMRPVWVHADSAGMSGCAFVSGPAWKAWDGALVVGFMAARKLVVLQLAADGSRALKETELSGDGERLRGLVYGPDGALYVSTDQKAGGDEIWRLTPQ